MVIIQLTGTTGSRNETHHFLPLAVLLTVGIFNHGLL